MATSPSSNPFNDRATMRRRFGYYFVGLAIGLVMLGILEAAKHAARQQQQQVDPGQPTAPQNVSDGAMPGKASFGSTARKPGEETSK